MLVSKYKPFNKPKVEIEKIKKNLKSKPKLKRLKESIQETIESRIAYD